VVERYEVSPLAGLCGGLNERNLGLTPPGYCMTPRTRLGHGIGYVTWDACPRAVELGRLGPRIGSLAMQDATVAPSCGLSVLAAEWSVLTNAVPSEHRIC
jgi:hypothetical protein